MSDGRTENKIYTDRFIKVSKVLKISLINMNVIYVILSSILFLVCLTLPSIETATAQMVRTSSVQVRRKPALPLVGHSNTNLVHVNIIR